MILHVAFNKMYTFVIYPVWWC